MGRSVKTDLSCNGFPTSARAQGRVECHLWMALVGTLLAGLRGAGVSRAGTVAVALSGGPDSLALAALVARWQHAQHDQGPPAAALIVDHGLRQESGEEAEAVAGMAAQLGLLPHVLRIGWRHGKPRQQEKMVAAREERYQLLAQECSRLGRQHLLVAHHADDQAETFMLRLLHASGIRGLGCMPLVSSALSGDLGVSVVRPLLAARKAELEAYCQQESLPYVVDPTNADVSYSRNRLRHLMQLSRQPGQSASYDVVKDVLRLQRLCATVAAGQEAAMAELLARVVLAVGHAVRLPALWTAAQEGRNSVQVRGLPGGVVGHEPRLALATKEVARRLTGFAQFALVDVSVLGSSAHGQVVVDLLTKLLGAVCGGKYPASSIKARALAGALRGGRLDCKFTGGGCYVQPVPGSKGKLCVIVPLAQQGYAERALQGALK